MPLLSNIKFKSKIFRRALLELYIIICLELLWWLTPEERVLKISFSVADFQKVYDFQEGLQRAAPIPSS